MQLPLFKVCSQCDKQKTVLEFKKRAGSPDGHRNVCLDCANLNERNRRAADQEKTRACARNRYQKNLEKERERNRNRMRLWRINSPEKAKAVDRKNHARYKTRYQEQGKRYRQKNKSRTKEALRKWFQDNPKKVIEYHNIRRARKMGALVGAERFTAKDWETIKTFYGNMCVRCLRTDRVLSMDHIVPLSKGGKHEINNIQPLCKMCNSEKGTKVADYRIRYPHN